MIVEMQALEQNGTWELFPLSFEKKMISCRWIYSIKVQSNGEVDHLNARLVEKDVLRYMSSTTTKGLLLLYYYYYYYYIILLLIIKIITVIIILILIIIII